MASNLVMRTLTSRAAYDARRAKPRTLKAATAKPPPASPARVASTTALSSQELVCAAV